MIFEIFGHATFPFFKFVHRRTKTISRNSESERFSPLWSMISFGILVYFPSERAFVICRLVDRLNRLWEISSLRLFRSFKVALVFVNPHPASPANRGTEARDLHPSFVFMYRMIFMRSRNSGSLTSGSSIRSFETFV